MSEDYSLPKLKINLNSFLNYSDNDSYQNSTFELITQPKSRKKNRLFRLSKIISNKKILPDNENSEKIIKTTLDKMFGKDYSGMMEKLKEEVYPSRNNNVIKIHKVKERFAHTRYSSEESVNEFYEKFRKFKIIDNKEPIQKLTPALAFIKSCNKNNLIPNPLGLVKRKGDERILNLNNQHVGDKYLKAISESLEYANHLNDFQLSSNRLTENGINYLFTSLTINKSLMQNISKLNLSKNRIGSNGTEYLVNYLKNDKCNIIELNLEDNNLKDGNIIKICDAIYKNKKLNIMYLNFGKNLISDNSIESLSNLLSNSENLKVLILRYNNLGNNSGALIINKIKNLSQLKILDLSWNKIGNELTQEMLFEEIANLNPNPNKIFQNFELNKCSSELKFNFQKNPFVSNEENKSKSTNNSKEKVKRKSKIKIIPKLIIPQRKASNFAKELGEYFSNKDNPLVHLDISHNNLPYEDCLLLSNESKNNHNILGLHINGNEMKINSLGFITAIDKNKRNESFYSKSHIYNNLETNSNLMKSNIENIRKIRSRNNCWICEGWREIEFIFKPKIPIKDPQFHLVKIHFNFDDFEPYDMIGNGLKYNIYRMCPPGNIFYFFSVDSIPVEYYGVDNYKIKSQHPIIFTFEQNYFDELNKIKLKEKYSIKNSTLINKKMINKILETKENENEIILNTERNEEKKKVAIYVLGKKTIEKNVKVIDENYLKIIKYCEPRPPKIKNNIIKPKSPWTFQNSIFYFCHYNYEGYDDKLISDCFEFDFKRCQFENEVKFHSELNDLKMFLKNYYKNIIDCYKYYSSFSGFDIFQISENSLKNFINKCNDFIDNEYNIENIISIKNEITSNLIDKEERSKKKNKNLSDNLVRHQFLNFLVKISIDKYKNKLKMFKNTLDAVMFSFKNHFENAIIGFDNNKWRIENYYNEKVDNFLLAYLPLLDGVFKTFLIPKGETKR